MRRDEGRQTMSRITVRSPSFARPSTRSATAVGASLLMVGTSLLLPSLVATAADGRGQTDHKVVVCHFVPAHGGTYIRTVVDVNGIHGHGKHDKDVIGALGAVDLVCPGPTVSEIPSDSGSPTTSHSTTGTPTATGTPTGTGTPTDTPTDSVTTTPTDTPTDTPTETPTSTEPATSVPSTSSPSTTPASEPGEPGGLPDTGGDPVLPGVLGLLFVVVGIAAMALGRPSGRHI